MGGRAPGAAPTRSANGYINQICEIIRCKYLLLISCQNLIKLKTETLHVILRI